MNRTELIKNTLLKLRELQQTEGYQEIENHLLLKEQETYILFEVDRELDTSLSSIDLKKYALKAINSDTINLKELEKGKNLHNELHTIITNFLSNDYVLIVYTENKSRYVNNQDDELFELVFKKTFKTKKIGKIKTQEVEMCSKSFAIGNIESETKTKLSIGIDLIYKNNMTYNGNSLQGENVLFYGHNIEENPFLKELFNSQRPAKLLNIVPLIKNNSFFDNVD